ncbi:MAG: hypothetical protein M1825_000897 [Sarcosagium campestre]|nr:MAG: hypothetical protein M1825_000897 [Sarcosagium campestre]
MMAASRQFIKRSPAVFRDNSILQAATAATAATAVTAVTAVRVHDPKTTPDEERRGKFEGGFEEEEEGNYKGGKE